MKNFDDLEFKPMHSNGIHAYLEFSNGYAVSVVSHDHSYGGGGNEGLYELAVAKDRTIVYDTPVTSDVEGYCDEDRISELMREVQKLTK